MQTINSLFIVSICREAATLISGLLHKAYSRLLSELKRQTQMPRSLLPTVSHLSGEEEEPWEQPTIFSESVWLRHSVCGAQLQKTPSLGTQTTTREASHSPCAHTWWKRGDMQDASHAHAM